MGRRRSIVAVAVAAVALDTALLGLIAPLLPEIEERTGAGAGCARRLAVGIRAAGRPLLAAELAASPTRSDAGRC